MLLSTDSGAATPCRKEHITASGDRCFFHATKGGIHDTLKKGSTGTSVLLRQEILRARGYYTGKLDRDFGDQTEVAVRAYQKDRTAPGAKIGGADGKPDGVVGSGTWNDLLALAAA